MSNMCFNNYCLRGINVELTILDSGHITFWVVLVHCNTLGVTERCRRSKNCIVAGGLCHSHSVLHTVPHPSSTVLWHFSIGTYLTLNQSHGTVVNLCSKTVRVVQDYTQDSKPVVWDSRNQDSDWVAPTTAQYSHSRCRIKRVSDTWE